MTVSEYFSLGEDDRLRQGLLQFVNSSFDEGKKIKDLQGVKFIADWYKEAKEAKKEEGEYNKRVILSTVVNKTTEELVKHLEPFYRDTIIKHVGIRTQFKEGVTESSFKTEFISIKPFVKFVKRVGSTRRELASVKFVFQLDTMLYLHKLQIRVNSEVKSIKIDKLGIEAKLMLLQITMEAISGVPVISLTNPVKLASKKLEIKNIVLFSRQSKSKSGAPFSWISRS